MFGRLVGTDAMAIDDQIFSVNFFELKTLSGLRRYSAEILLAPDDRIILDDDSVTTLRARAMRVVPATVYSRMLAKATAA